MLRKRSYKTQMWINMLSRNWNASKIKGTVILLCKKILLEFIVSILTFFIIKSYYIGNGIVIVFDNLKLSNIYILKNYYTVQGIAIIFYFLVN